MAKTNSKHLRITLLFCLVCSKLFSQAKSGLENYNYLSREEKYYWMPVMHYQTTKGWYGELRYNYEALKTVSFYAGKTFSMGGSAIVDLTPMIGYSVGSFNGVSLAANADLEYKKWYAASQTQYSRDITGSCNSFFFNWSELSFSVFPYFFTGIVGQFTVQEGDKDWQPGFLAGLSLGRFTIPAYFFKPFSPDYQLILGVNYEFTLKRKIKKTKGNYAVELK